MAAYRRVDDLSHLRADCLYSRTPGSAPGPTIGFTSYKALGHMPPRLTTICFQCTLTYKKSDSDSMSTDRLV